MKCVENVDIVYGLAWGDEGKGKVSSCMVRDGLYNFVCRWAGGPNAGHTVYIDGDKYKTHHIPSGVFFGVPSIIGPGCVVNPKKFYEELDYLETNGFDSSLVKVSPRAHIIQNKHVQDDNRKLASKLGTTGNGIAPCYSEKSARTGIMAAEVLPDPYLWDEKLFGNVLCEGAQGVWLDLDWGQYPWVTSSTTLPYAACSLGFPMNKVREVVGVIKAYDTRSGNDPLFPETLFGDSVLSQIGEVGTEYGVTTGRRRKVNWLNFDLLRKSIKITGPNQVIVNKVDVLEQVGVFKIIVDGKIKEFSEWEDMAHFISKDLIRSGVETIWFSRDPEEIV
jgi:adenylosuccinate synthase